MILKTNDSQVILKVFALLLRHHWKADVDITEICDQTANFISEGGTFNIVIIDHNRWWVGVDQPGCKYEIDAHHMSGELSPEAFSSLQYLVEANK